MESVQLIWRIIYLSDFILDRLRQSLMVLIRNVQGLFQTLVHYRFYLPHLVQWVTGVHYFSDVMLGKLMKFKVIAHTTSTNMQILMLSKSVCQGQLHHHSGQVLWV